MAPSGLYARLCHAFLVLCHKLHICTDRGLTDIFFSDPWPPIAPPKTAGARTAPGRQFGFKPKFYTNRVVVYSILVPTHPSEDDTRMSRVSGNFPVQLATRLPDWLAGGLLRCIVLHVCSCVVSFSKVSRARHARLVADKSLASS